ncbi:aliphatic sulfonate ABC transporter permease SsuC [Trinickia dinghuensis]|uniref:Aliphatic sulfonate ABC transporter permease SsuC n=1 Tax=Trinickia dinghuensis TaxID=2291023 RepID=A0A3D8JYK2_9BURK|nr:aliphatic sulfonate ABC transporter permease SsuC [Trinickia dinghuensis]RDU97960.1 aliphatic sulfonate ABC transporter permease SsuC [Trinickia dinghuensis]
MRTRAVWSGRILPWIVPTLAFIVWEAGARSGWLSARILPEPWAVARAAWGLFESGELWADVKISAARALGGFVIGGGIGFLLALATGCSKLLEALLDSTVQMIRNIPVLAMIPLVILWFGIEEQAKLFLVALGVFFPVYVNTFHGIRSVDAGLVEMAKSYGLRGFALYRDAVLPGALPSILVGVRFALGLMWVMLIVAETISAQSGIGYMTMNAREFMQTDVVVVGILLYALLGKLADQGARALETWLVPWRSPHAVARSASKGTARSGRWPKALKRPIAWRGAKA